MSQHTEVTELVSVTPEGGDPRIEKIDLEELRNEKLDANAELGGIMGNIADQYDDLAKKADELLEAQGQNPDLQLTLSGLSELRDKAREQRNKFQNRLETGFSAKSILDGRTPDQYREDCEYAVELIAKELSKMTVAAGALERHDRMEGARDEVQIASEIAQNSIIDKKEQANPTEEDKERSEAVEAGYKKLDLKVISRLLGDISSNTPQIVGEKIDLLDKMLDGDGKDTYELTKNTTASIKELASSIASGLFDRQVSFIEAGVDHGDLKQFIANMKALAESATQREDQARNSLRGVRKREVGRLKAQEDQLRNIDLLLSPAKYGDTVILDGKKVDVEKRRTQLRRG